MLTDAIAITQRSKHLLVVLFSEIYKMLIKVYSKIFKMGGLNFV